MSKKEKNTQESPAPADGADTGERLKGAAEGFEEKYNELNDRFLRLAADFDNYKKRSESERAQARLAGVMDMAASVFAFLDSLELALRHASAQDADTESLTEGVRLTYEQSVSQLGNFGINQISAEVGEKFDPSFHQAIENRPSSDISKGCVAEEISKGYRAGDALIRPVAVAVSSGPPEE